MLSRSALPRFTSSRTTSHRGSPAAASARHARRVVLGAVVEDEDLELRDASAVRTLVAITASSL
jgi:hypothetical protein